MENNFCVFILTHGRPDNVITYKTLKRCGYTGKIYFIVDNEDKTIEQYKKNFGKESIIVFNKKKMADQTDEANNFDNRKVIVHARNVCFKIAEWLKIEYFLELDDDYTQFKYRFENKLGYEAVIKNLDIIFDIFIEFLKRTPTLSIAFSQGGDHIGGFSTTKLKRKCMNSFFCTTTKKFQFVGSINEDVNTYTVLAHRGNLFFTFTSVQLDQKETQTQKGGMTDIYKDSGTFVKSFTTVLMHPSGTRVSMMNTNYSRLHHLVKWNNTAPLILNEKYKSKLQRCLNTK